MSAESSYASAKEAWMSEHRASIHWSRNGHEFTHKEYSRDHVWTFVGGSEVFASAAPHYLGNPARVDPEEAFVASVSSCHMLTFLALAARDGFVVDRYQDEAVGQLEREENKRLAITRITLRPTISWGGSPPSEEQLAKLHASAHRHCFIANSVKTEISVEG